MSRRDRHGRGLRGRLVPPVVVVGERQVAVPAALTRAGRFDDLVRGVLADLERRWPGRLDGMEAVVEEVPAELVGTEGVVADDTAGGTVPLARLIAGPVPRLVVYRRPLEARAHDRGDLADLVREVVHDAVTDLLGVDRDELD